MHGSAAAHAYTAYASHGTPLHAVCLPLSLQTVGKTLLPAHHATAGSVSSSSRTFALDFLTTASSSTLLLLLQQQQQQHTGYSHAHHSSAWFPYQVLSANPPSCLPHVSCETPLYSTAAELLAGAAQQPPTHPTCCCPRPGDKYAAPRPIRM
jgi:hypothetical protein